MDGECDEDRTKERVLHVDTTEDVPRNNETAMTQALTHQARARRRCAAVFLRRVVCVRAI